MGANPRARKLADRIKVIVSQALERGLKDPRLGFITITEVRMTGDLQKASIFYTVYGSDEERDESAKALKSATGYLRTEVGKGISTRITPSLEFFLDAIPETADNIAKLLAEAAERDAQVRTQAAGASYAGDEDPYQKPKEYLDADDTDSVDDIDDVEDDIESGFDQNPAEDGDN
ncbi:MAG: 30S ribosome-binding factor RbfA [Microbacteriaceae bacterium]